MRSQYGLGEFLGNCVYLAYTKLRFPGARLVRLPFCLRGGKARLRYGRGLTVGYGCRFDLAGEGVVLEIGEGCKMNDRVHIVAHESVRIGDSVLMASNIFISDTSHGSFTEDASSPDVAPDDRPLVTKPTAIGNNVWIGEGVCIMPGVEVGDGCTIGANSVVTKSVPANTVVAGAPARAIRRWSEESRTWERVG
ncbi:DapH/DapD/GlmU-related protein [Olsenella intestinalis]|uniref:DapH/DapD/GlmU-related protein n=1 Tax=Olsenella intestinalis TaxID=2930083 RepID=UPI00200FFF2F|nr:DapH/DapD/GlmU-related protein [Olsenella intestinalis]